MQHNTGDSRALFDAWALSNIVTQGNTNKQILVHGLATKISKDGIQTSALVCDKEQHYHMFLENPTIDSYFPMEDENKQLKNMYVSSLDGKLFNPLLKKNFKQVAVDEERQHIIDRVEYFLMNTLGEIYKELNYPNQADMINDIPEKDFSVNRTLQWNQIPIPIINETDEVILSKIQGNNNYKLKNAANLK